jgi:hypothetical protein
MTLCSAALQGSLPDVRRANTRFWRTVVQGSN